MSATISSHTTTVRVQAEAFAVDVLVARCLDGPRLRPLVRRLDAPRRFRNPALYRDPPPVPEDELQQALADAAEIVSLLEQRLGAG